MNDPDIYYLGGNGLEMQHLSQQRRTEGAKIGQTKISVVEQIQIQPESMRIIVEESVDDGTDFTFSHS